jgi:ornithine lipid ester-linked acyl 2-hydroxylase
MRPLRWPFSAVNKWIMNLAVLAPFLREAKGKQQASEKRFWEKFGK